MDNAQKAITIGVGLFITIIVVAAVMTITGIGQDLLSSGQQQLSGLSGQLATSLTAQYAGQTMSGTSVKTTIQNYYNSTDIAVYVYTQTKTNVSTAAAGETMTVAKDGTCGAKLMQCNQVNLGDSLAIKFDKDATKAAQAASVKKVTMDFDTSYNVPLSTLVNNIQVTNQYRSFVVTNDENGRTVALLFIRVQ